MLSKTQKHSFNEDLEVNEPIPVSRYDVAVNVLRNYEKWKGLQSLLNSSPVGSMCSLKIDADVHSIDSLDALYMINRKVTELKNQLLELGIDCAKLVASPESNA